SSGIIAARSCRWEIGMANKVQAAAAIDTEVVFRCQHCKAELVVTGTDTGLSMNCSRCGKLTAVPRRTKRVATVDPAAQIEEIQRKLTENESQRTRSEEHTSELQSLRHLV